MLCPAEPSAGNTRWQANFPALTNGAACESTAVPLGDDSLLVAVVMPGANPSSPTLRMGERTVPVRLIGHDPVSRLGFFKLTGTSAPNTVVWLSNAGSGLGSELRAITPRGPEKCMASGWVKQVGGKVLPLALLRVNFESGVPPPGTPLVDSSGRVAAIMFQASGGGSTGYAIPAEAVHRVRRDVCNGGSLIRGWLGLALRAENQSPQIVRVLPNSPAEAAGIRSADVLLAVGTRQIYDYADAANAFFYLIPGQPERVRLLRGKEPLEFTVIPARQKAD